MLLAFHGVWSAGAAAGISSGAAAAGAAGSTAAAWCLWETPGQPGRHLLLADPLLLWGLRLLLLLRCGLFLFWRQHLVLPMLLLLLC